MAKGFYKGLLVASVVILIHAAYSTAEWRHFSRKTAHYFDTIPLDIVIQTLVGFLLGMIGVVRIAGDFKEIRSNVELSQKSWENTQNRPSFYIFNHRGKALAASL